MINEDNIKELFSNINLNEEERIYFDLHVSRLAYTTNLINEFCSAHSVQRVLDIGPHFLTRCIIEFLGPEVSVSTLGYEYPKLVPLELIDEHVTFNMIECEDKSVLFRNQPFDLIIFSEIIEHLNISPELVLVFLNKLLNRGGRIIH